MGVGCSRAATTRSPDGILCRASLDVVLKHSSSWRGDPCGFIFWALGWALGLALGLALGARQGHPRGSSRRRGHFAGISIAGLEAPVEDITAV